MKYLVIYKDGTSTEEKGFFEAREILRKNPNAKIIALVILEKKNEIISSACQNFRAYSGDFVPVF
ncbi:MAG: hypothetical protein PHI86_00030 [Candidatus Omnitrophica bacterium]|nr:hypothetical protein [Candidatus Omnitrophota bacterium]HOX55180.1 hypothetical protein [Candidatus Omnitrophota bacterium]